MRWLVWGALLMLTNGASTLTSRARNTPSYGYHAAAACFNHGTWFFTNILFVGVAIDISKSSGWREGALSALFYVTCSTIGSIGMHWISIRYFEKGDRRVGSYHGDHP